MSRNKHLIPHSHTSDAIQSILSASLWLKQNEIEVIKQLTEISKMALGIANCSKFRMTEGNSDYGVFEVMEIELKGFCSKGTDEFCWPIYELYWTIELSGLGKMLDKYHPLYYEFGAEMPNDDKLCGMSVVLNPRTHKLETKIYDFEYKFTITPIYNE